VGKKTEIICEYQPYIEQPPVSGDQLYGQACSNDSTTVNSWREIWLRQAKENHANFGPFADRGLGKLWGKHRFSPALVLGSGPSLRGNAHLLKDNPGIPVISCLHNFHFLEDQGVKVDYYVSLDAGPVTVEEVSEGGTRTAEEYWELTKDRTLLCYVATHPELLAKWRGKIYFFNCPVPDHSIIEEMDKTERFRTFVSTGGNVLGACVYIAKAVFGCNPIAFLGADFSFSYLHKFHGWDSKYDANIGHCVRMTDVYGNSVKSWQSYANFKAWFDFIAMRVPGHWINCTEGGTFGAYPGGNIRAVEQMDLADFLAVYRMCEEIKDQCDHPVSEAQPKLLF
jgi:hypothetical protein